MTRVVLVAVVAMILLANASALGRRRSTTRRLTVSKKMLADMCTSVELELSTCRSNLQELEHKSSTEKAHKEIAHENALTSFKAETSNKIESLEKDLREAEKVKVEATSKLSALQTRVDELMAANSALEQQNVEIKADLSHAKTMKESLEKELATLNSAKAISDASAEASLASSKEAVHLRTLAEQKAEALNDEKQILLTKAQSEATEAQIEAARLQGQAGSPHVQDEALDKLTEEVTELQGESTKSALELLEEKVGELSAVALEIKERMDAGADELPELKKKFEELQGQMKSSGTKVEGIDQECDISKEQCTEMAVQAVAKAQEHAAPFSCKVLGPGRISCGSSP